MNEVNTAIIDYLRKHEQGSAQDIYLATRIPYPTILTAMTDLVNGERLLQLPRKNLGKYEYRLANVVPVDERSDDSLIGLVQRCYAAVAPLDARTWQELSEDEQRRFIRNVRTRLLGLEKIIEKMEKDSNIVLPEHDTQGEAQVPVSEPAPGGENSGGVLRG